MYFSADCDMLVKTQDTFLHFVLNAIFPCAGRIIIYAWCYFPSVRSGLVQLLVNFVQYTWLEGRLLTGPACHRKFIKHRVKRDLDKDSLFTDGPYESLLRQRARQRDREIVERDLCRHGSKTMAVYREEPRDILLAVRTAVEYIR